MLAQLICFCPDAAYMYSAHARGINKDDCLQQARQWTTGSKHCSSLSATQLAFSQSTGLLRIAGVMIITCTQLSLCACMHAADPVRRAQCHCSSLRYR